MHWFRPLFGVAIALSGQEVLAKHRLTDPLRLHENAKATWNTCVKNFARVASGLYAASRRR
jgi:hypothetical protein